MEDLTDVSFDFINCRDVIEHLIDYHRGLDEMYRVFKDGGGLLIQTTNGFVHEKLKIPHRTKTILSKIFPTKIKMEDTSIMLSDDIKKLSKMERETIIGSIPEGFSEHNKLVFPSELQKILVIPNGASVRDIPFPNTEKRESMRNHFGLEKKPTAVFLASGGYEPNDNAAEYICLKLAPLLIDITFVLVGSACDIILNKHSNQLTENIKLMGVVSKEDKKGLLYAADLALNPVTKGSGTNIKVFDYLAAGLPLVTTPVGARGIDFTNNEDVVIAEIDDFSEVIKMLINDDALRSSISKKEENWRRNMIGVQSQKLQKKVL